MALTKPSFGFSLVYVSTWSLISQNEKQLWTLEYDFHVSSSMLNSLSLFTSCSNKTNNREKLPMEKIS